MNQKRRMQFIMTVLALVVIGITALVSYRILMDKTNAIEKGLLQSQGISITKLINSELENLLKTDRDYAQWDDTLAYHQSGSEVYAADTFTPDVFANLDVSHMLFFDNEGLIRTGFTSLRKSDSVDPLTEADARDFTEKYGGVIRASQKSGKDIRGLVLIEGRPCLITITRITDTGGTVLDGSMALLRPLDDQIRIRIKDILGCEVKLEAPGKGKDFVPTDKGDYFHVAIGDFLTNGSGASARLNLMDILWEPVLGLEIMSSNQIWVLSRQILTMIITITCVSIAVIMALQSWLNNTLILRPIRNLGERLNGVSDYTKLNELSVFPEQMLLKEDLSFVGKIHGILRRISEDSIQLQRDRLSTRLALDASMAGTWEYDGEKQMLRVDAQSMKLLDIELPSHSFSRDILLENVSPEHRHGLNRLIAEYTRDKAIGFQMECQMKNRTGEYHWFLIKGDALEWDREDRCTLFSGILLDIDQKKRLESELLYLSYHDKLTGLFNRRYFEEHLQGFDKPENLPVAIFVADINGLKLANDAFGHERGDKLLKQAAASLQAAAGSGATISRWGGDEYAVLLPQTDEIQAEEIFKKIKDSCSEKGSHGLTLHLAVGYSVKKWGSLSLQHVVRSAEEKMYRDKLTESRKAHADFLEKFRDLLHEKGIETYEHCQRVTSLSCAIGSRLNLNRDTMEEITALGDLHDIGKIAMPVELFSKTENLTEMEWALVHSHPEIGFRIVALMQDYAHIAQAVLSHHEWYDGTGYPRALKEQEIPLAARIVAVADAVDVMLSGRPYKDKILQEAVIEELHRMQGIQFDPVAVENMIDILENDPLVKRLYSA